MDNTLTADHFHTPDRASILNHISDTLHASHDRHFTDTPHLLNALAFSVRDLIINPTKYSETPTETPYTVTTTNISTNRATTAAFATREHALAYYTSHAWIGSIPTVRHGETLIATNLSTNLAPLDAPTLKPATLVGDSLRLVTSTFIHHFAAAFLNASLDEAQADTTPLTLATLIDTMATLIHSPNAFTTLHDTASNDTTTVETDDKVLIIHTPNTVTAATTRRLDLLTGETFTFTTRVDLATYTGTPTTLNNVTADNTTIDTTLYLAP